MTSPARPPTFDPASRPHVRRIDGQEAVDPTALAGAQVLVAIHDHLREQLDQVSEAVEAVCAGRADPGAARSLVNRMTMRQNYWSLGAFCAAYCRLLSIHHTIEDEHMFVQLRRADPALSAVLDRLGEEHEVIAGILDALDRALVALAGGADHDAAGAAARTATARLADVLRSHLDYEEAELVVPLARAGILV